MQALSQSSPNTRVVAIIGTAGRDKTRPMTADLWEAMLADVRGRLFASDHLVSGGAAWSDHLAVAAFLRGWTGGGLTLYLPAPLERGAWGVRFAGGGGTSGAAANYYHARFKAVTGVDGLAQIALAAQAGALVHAQPVARGYTAMFARNAQVARAASACLAYTWGATEPVDGGTVSTWRQMSGIERQHVSLWRLAPESEHEPQEPHGQPHG